jgi:DNA mismatch repair ATPase MutS
MFYKLLNLFILIIDDGPLAIEAGRHPVVEILHPEQFVVK